MRIIAGSLKGRKIPFQNSKFDNADITSEKVKEALFSSLLPHGESLDGYTFLDLYGCSGQIGLEAYSRGARVIINERDKRRVAFINELVTSLGIGERMQVLSFSDEVCLRYLSKKGLSFDFVYLDPPYIKQRGQVSFYGNLLDSIYKNNILNIEACCIVQSYQKNVLSDIPASFEEIRTKKYGTALLSYYKLLPEA